MSTQTRPRKPQPSQSSSQPIIRMPTEIMVQYLVVMMLVHVHDEYPK